MVEVVNVVGTGAFDREFDLAALSKRLLANQYWVAYDPTSHPVLRLRLRDAESPLIGLYRTGSFHIAGAETAADCYTQYTELVDLLRDLQVLTDTPSPPADHDSQTPTPHDFTIDNMVAVGDLNQQISLHAFVIAMGLDTVEYEPEQFPRCVLPGNRDRCRLWGICKRESSDHSLHLCDANPHGV